MGANFMWEEAIGEERAKQLLNINAPAVLLSYIRPMVSSMTNSSKYPALNIPFIDFTKVQIKQIPGVSWGFLTWRFKL